MTFIQITEHLKEDRVVYFTSPRWEKRVVALMDTFTLGLISVDYSANEGVIGNTFDETEVGNRLGRFLNQPDELFQDDFILVTYKEAKKYEEEYKAKWGV